MPCYQSQHLGVQRLAHPAARLSLGPTRHWCLHYPSHQWLVELGNWHFLDLPGYQLWHGSPEAENKFHRTLLLSLGHYILQVTTLYLLICHPLNQCSVFPPSLSRHLCLLQTRRSPVSSLHFSVCRTLEAVLPSGPSSRWRISSRSLLSARHQRYWCSSSDSSSNELKIHQHFYCSQSSYSS